jgi:hypothetical protein
MKLDEKAISANNIFYKLIDSIPDACIEVKALNLIRDVAFGMQVGFSDPTLEDTISKNEQLNTIDKYIVDCVTQNIKPYSRGTAYLDIDKQEIITEDPKIICCDLHQSNALNKYRTAIKYPEDIFLLDGLRKKEHMPKTVQEYELQFTYETGGELNKIRYFDLFLHTYNFDRDGTPEQIMFEKEAFSRECTYEEMKKGILMIKKETLMNFLNNKKEEKYYIDLAWIHTYNPDGSSSNAELTFYLNPLKKEIITNSAVQENKNLMQIIDEAEQLGVTITNR